MAETIAGYNTNAESSQDSLSRMTVTKVGTKTHLDVLNGATDGIEGGPVTVGTTAVELTFAGKTKSITIMSDSDNTGKIWWGKSDIDNTGANAFGRLTQDRAVTIEYDDITTAIYVVSDTATQTIFKVALT